MEKKRVLPNCANCIMNRRRFLSAGAKLCAAASLLHTPGQLAAQSTTAKKCIRIIYALHAPQQPGPDWPNVGFDFQPVMNRTSAMLTAACPNMQFLPAMANGPEQAEKILADDTAAGNIDGYLVYQLNCWNRVVQTIVTSNKPVLYVDFQYGGSGGFLVYTADMLRKKTVNFGFVASSDPNDLIAAVECFRSCSSAEQFAQAVTGVRMKNTPNASNISCKVDICKTRPVKECIERMAQSKILALRDQNALASEPYMGIPVEYITFAELDDAWKKADRDQAVSIADAWQNNAQAVIDVSRETLENSAAMYLGMKTIMKNRNANAITINCLGGFYGGHIHAYPCLGFHQLDNDGMIGGCECDVPSVAAKVMLNTLTGGRPGYISDPVIDTSKRQITYAHCVASNKVFGPQGTSNPYSIMTHSEDRQGASVRSVMPLGYMTTTIELRRERNEILFHQGKAVANDPDDRACRTKLAVEPVGDIEKLFTEWDAWGWHRVTCYGDLKESIHELANAMNCKVIHEA